MVSDVGIAVLSALLGGLVFSFLRSVVWKWYTDPKLRMAESSSPTFRTDENGEISQQVLRVPVFNEGKSAATNCKPEIRMEGTLDSDLYEVVQHLQWAEHDSPESTTINSGERTEFDLLRITSEGDGEYITVTPDFHVQFPGNNTWGDSDGVTIWKREDGKTVDAEITERLDKSTFSRIQWHDSAVVVTADNTDKTVGELSFKFGENRGLVGMKVEIK